MSTSTSQTHQYKVDFSWKKFKSLITDTTSPTTSSAPLYIVQYRATKPYLVFKSGADTSVTLGTGNCCTTTIHGDCRIGSNDIDIRAMKRWQTEYTHNSYAYNPSYSSSEKTTSSAEPVLLRWTSASDFKTWDFICLDPEGNPVAKFSANMWSMTKVGLIEFVGPQAEDEKFREEITVVGLTLMYLMVLRSSNIFYFFAAIFSKTGRKKGEVLGANGAKAEKEEELEMSDDDSYLGRSGDGQEVKPGAAVAAK